jgi:glucose-6-phosphate dehydrogenase assembly protein OpcA
MSDLETMLPGSKEVPFSELGDMLATSVPARKKSPIRASTATVVVVGPPARLAPVVQALAELGEARGVRAILIAEGTESKPVVRMSDTIVAIDGLSPEYLNNAVAAVRLPSLPALIWWRGGSPQALDDVTKLADRLVLDTEDPDDLWLHATGFFEETALTDLRWTRLTKWRAVLAHLFDLSQVRDAIGAFRQLEIAAGDGSAARLFAAWLVSCLEWRDADIQINVVRSDDLSVLESVRLAGSPISITVRRLPGRDCLEASIAGEIADVRVSPVGHATLSACIGEELGVRSRDLAFERALSALGGLHVGGGR